MNGQDFQGEEFWEEERSANAQETWNKWDKESREVTEPFDKR